MRGNLTAMDVDGFAGVTLTCLPMKNPPEER